MSTFIYIPREGVTTDLDPAMEEAALSPLTYKEALFTDVTFNQSGYICAFTNGGLIGGARSTVNKHVDDYAAYVSDTQRSSASFTLGFTRNLALCDRYEFDNLVNENWTPPELNENVEYHNNMSEGGHFIGRTVISRARKMTVNPLSFSMSAGRINELITIRDGMRRAPFYVSVLAPNNARYVFYGWTERDPEIEYLTDYGQVRFSFEMRGMA